jgi:hypothetical protein
LYSKWEQIFRWKAPYMTNAGGHGSGGAKPRVVEVHGGVDAESRDIVVGA